MPYIRQNERDVINRTSVDKLPAMGIGDLNYTISREVHNWLFQVGLKYDKINHAIGVLECAKASLIETVLIPYEKTKMKQNGNISELDKDYYDKL